MPQREQLQRKVMRNGEENDGRNMLESLLRFQTVEKIVNIKVCLCFFFLSEEQRRTNKKKDRDEKSSRDSRNHSRLETARDEIRVLGKEEKNTMTDREKNENEK